MLLIASVTGSERVSSGRGGRSPESCQLAKLRFHMVRFFWNGPALYVTAHRTGKRRKGRNVMGMKVPYSVGAGFESPHPRGR